MKKKVLLIGEVMTLLISDDFAKLEEVNKFSKGVAGAEVNVCVGLTRLDLILNILCKTWSRSVWKICINF